MTVPQDVSGARPKHQPTSAEDPKWEQALEKARRTRLKRVQASAAGWLGVLTTLLGLLGSVVLLKGGNLVTEVTSNGGLQILLITLVSLVFLLAVLAVIVGSFATWGGLKDITPIKKSSGQTSDGTQQAPRTRQKQVIKLILWLARIPDDDREKALQIFDTPEAAEKEKSPVEQYKYDIETNAERNRIYLHASRSLGVAAAISIITLAVAAIIVGTASPPVPGPADVVVVYHGRFICVPVSDSAKYTDVTQVISVSGC